MKRKSIFILAATMTAIVGCSKQELIETTNPSLSSPIMLSAGVSKSSKGADATLTTIKTDPNAIGLFAYKGTDGYPGGANQDIAIASNYKMFWNDTDAKWVIWDALSIPVSFYWPDAQSNQRLSFYAYFPYESPNITDVNPSEVGADITTPASFRLTVPTDVASQSDLLVARNEPTSPVVTVALAFNHVTTKFSFQAQTNVKEWEVTIHEVTLEGINNTGVYTFATRVAPTEPNLTWSAQSGNTTYQIPIQGGSDITFSLFNGFKQISSTANGESLFLIPQDLANNGNTPLLKVLYSIHNTTTGSTIANRQIKSLQIGNANSVSDGELKTVWTKGRIMNYKLTFAASEPGQPGSLIDFDVTVGDWNIDNSPLD